MESIIQLLCILLARPSISLLLRCSYVRRLYNLLENKADVNPVNNDDKLPLTIINDQLDKLKDEPDCEEKDVKIKRLNNLGKFLMSRGGKSTWRDELPKY
jgi:hypothetical protein